MTYDEILDATYNNIIDATYNLQVIIYRQLDKYKSLFIFVILLYVV